MTTHLRTPIRSRLFRLLLVAAIAVGAGCAAFDPRSPVHDEGMMLVAQGRYEEGIAKLEQASSEYPRSAKFKADLANQRAFAVNQLYVAAMAALNAGRYADAKAALERVQVIDPNNTRVSQVLSQIRRDERSAQQVAEARKLLDKGDIAGAESELAKVLAENPGSPQALELKRAIADRHARVAMEPPTLRPAFRRLVTLDFRDAPLRSVLDAMSRNAGINYILDKDVRPELRTTIVVRNTPLDDAIDLILMTNQLDKKVLNDTTLLIYPATAQKSKDYQDLVVRTFHLSSGDAKQAQALLKTLIKIRDIHIDEKLNLIVIRDSLEAVRLAEKLIGIYDRGEPEVVLELEVLEVRRSRILDLGIQPPTTFTLTPLPASGTTLTLQDLRNLNASTIGVTVPPAIINFNRELGDVNVLANPRARVKNREKAKVLIGEKLPVITSTTTIGFVAQNVQYLDVGLKVEVEPEIHPDNDVGIKVSLEVSSVTKEIRTVTGLLVYQVGTRQASTTLRLRDGETQILAGLISDEDRRNASGIPGLGDLPIIGRLFSSQRDEGSKTEIVLSITPRLVRGIPRMEAGMGEFWSGTEASLRTRPLTLGTEAVNVAQAGAVGALGLAGTGRPVAQSLPVQLLLQAPPTVKAGDEFKVTVALKSEVALKGMPLQVGFDPAALEFKEAAEAGFFKQGGETPAFSSNANQKDGRVFVGLSRASGDGAKGEGGVVTLTFRALAARPRTEIRLIAATPVAAGADAPVVTLPAPAGIAITQ